MLLDEQAVTCYVALLPAGVQTLTVPDTRHGFVCVLCIAAIFTRTIFNAFNWVPAGETKAPRGTRQRRENVTLSMGVELDARDWHND